MEQNNVKARSLSKMFDDYTSNSTVHGVKYLGERRRHWSERIFWIFAFLFSISGCSIFIGKMYIKWDLSPVISTFTEKKATAFQIPLPAITICPLVKVKRELLDYTKSYYAVYYVSEHQTYKLTDERRLRLKAANQVCDRKIRYYEINSGFKLDEIVTNLKEIAPKIEDTIEDYEYIQTQFFDIMTDEGLCFTFNMLNSSEIFRDKVLDDKFVSLKHDKISSNWSLQGGYPTFDEDTYPRRILKTGSKSGFGINLKQMNIDYDSKCNGLLQGFKVILHTPGEIPQGSMNFFYALIDEIVKVSVKPYLITTLEGLTDYSPEKRECFLNHEKYLKFFKVYTQSNCELECLTNFTLNACGCVKFSMPRDNNTLICGQRFIETECYNTAADDLMRAKLHKNLKSSSDVGYKKSSYSPCNCLPDCNSINYDYEVDRTYFKFSEHYPGLKEINISFSRIEISIKEPQISFTTRSENYGVYEFLGNCGGLLGLFLGVSLLSVIEILYHFTFRPAYNLLRHNKVHQTSPTIESYDKQSDNVSDHDQMDTVIVDNNLLNEVKIISNEFMNK